MIQGSKLNPTFAVSEGESPTQADKEARLKVAIDRLRAADSAPFYQSLQLAEQAAEVLKPFAGCGLVAAAVDSIVRGKVLSAVVFLRRALGETPRPEEWPPYYELWSGNAAVARSRDREYLDRASRIQAGTCFVLLSLDQVTTPPGRACENDVEWLKARFRWT